jgi:hypothetical protein
MDILQGMFGTYPAIDVVPQNFVDALTPGAPGFAVTLTTLLITFALGFMVYVYSFLLVDREKAVRTRCGCTRSTALPTSWASGCSCGVDQLRPFLVLPAGHHRRDRLGGIRAVLPVPRRDLRALRRSGARTPPWDMRCSCAALQVLIFFVSLNLLRVELHDETMFKFWIFTQVIICCAPGLFWEQRKTRIGACWQLNIVLVLVAIMSFNPNNMWALIAPQYFSVANNPWYYVVGIVTLCFALRGCWIYAKLPAKPEKLPDGKKPIW